MTTRRLRDRLATGLLLAAPLFVALLAIPLASYQANRGEFLSGVRAILPFVLAGGAAVCLGIVAAWCVPRSRGTVAVVCGGIAVWMVFQDVLVPLGWTPFDGTQRLTWTPGEAAIQLGLALVIAAVLRAVPPRHRRVLLLVVLAPTFAGSGISLASVYAASTRPPAAARAAGGTTITARSPHALPNVYQIVLDGFGGDAFDAAARAAGLRLDSFVRYADARASFVATDLSVPNFLAGSTPGRRPVVAWSDATRSAGIREALADAGYRVATYVPDRARAWASGRARTIVTSQDLSAVDQAVMDRATLARIAAVRVAPAPARLRVLDFVSRYRVRDYLYYRQFNVDLVARFLRDEPQRPPTGQYVYIHLMLPHPPYVRDDRCRPVAASTYDRQATCAMRQVAVILAELKRLDRLRGSLVVVQSDHGMNTGRTGVGSTQASGLDLPRPSGAVAAAIGRHTVEVGGIDGFLQRTAPLLLVHWPDAPAAPLAVSQAPALLSDLPATIATAVGLPAARWPGIPLQRLPADRPRARPFFAATRATGHALLPVDSALVLDADGRWRFADAQGR